MSYIVTYDVNEKLEEYYFDTPEDVILDVQEMVPPFDADDPEDISYTFDLIRREILIQWLCDDGRREPLEFEDLLKATQSNHARIKLSATIVNMGRRDV